MKSDLTCPVEIVSVSIQRDTGDTKESGPIICLIDFYNLSEKEIDSIQMNIICFGSDDARIGGRLVRAGVHGGGRERFSGTFVPDHVDGVARVEASVEKVWFQDGVIWRREERNVREYRPNALPAGRELDRLRAVAGPDAAGYAREDDTVWLCVCGRANRTSDDVCLRCRRDRAHVLKAYSFSAIDSTLGRKERILEQQTRETLRRSSEQTVEQMTAVQSRQRKRRRRLTAVIVLLVFAAVALAMARWGVPYAVCWYAGRQLESGRAADAKDLFAWVEQGWPGQFGAQERANEAERVIIDGLLAIGTQDALSQAAQRAGVLEDGAREEQANLALARLAIDSGDHAAAESLLRAMPTNEEAQALLLELVYSIAAEAKEQLDYPTAIERFGSLGDYSDARAQRDDSIYLYGRQLMRAGEYQAACDQFMQVTGEADAVELIRQCRYALAQEKQQAGEYVEAAQLYESLGVYEEAEERGRLCRYTAGMDALEDGNLAEAAEQLSLAEDYEDAPQRFADAAFTLASAALEEGRYQEAIGWLERLERTQEVADAFNRAVYAYAQELEAEGQMEAAAVEYASLGEYEDASERARELEYTLAVQEMETSPQAALDRFEGLGEYRDAQEQADRCRYMLAEQAMESEDYESAIEQFNALEEYQDAQEQARRCRYALAGVRMEEERFEEAAALYEACGAYLDAEDGVQRARYAAADALYEAGEYAQAAAAFEALGSYGDAGLRAAQCEDTWLSSAYNSARMDMDVGDYASVMETLEPYWQEELPERYADIRQMYEEACLNRAQELSSMGRPFDALTVLERIPENTVAQNRMDAYVYQIVGVWEDTRGREYIFRRDGTCSIAGEEGYFGGSGYEITIGSQPYPTDAGYSIISIRNGSLTLRNLDSGGTVRLSYVGEVPEEAAGTLEDTDQSAAEEEPAQTPDEP